jgi:hypothetical protein
LTSFDTPELRYGKDVGYVYNNTVGVRQWWHRHAGVLAVAFALLAMLLAVVVVVQAVMLRTRGWGVPIGNVAEWIAAVGALAAFGALFYAATEWRAAQVERRDSEAEQARLIIVEPVEPDRSSGSLRWIKHFDEFVVRNYSASPVFNLDVESLDDSPDALVYQNVRVPSTQRQSEMSRPSRVPVLQAGRATEPLNLVGGGAGVPKIQHLTFAFTDAKGRRWRRTGTDQPERSSGS